MTKYTPGEARAWALESLRGCCGCVSPTFTSDLSALNEAAIRHDVALEKQHGMSGVLIVSEAGTTPAEMRRFTEIVVDEAGDDPAPSSSAPRGSCGKRPPPGRRPRLRCSAATAPTDHCAH